MIKADSLYGINMIHDKIPFVSYVGKSKRNTI